MEQRLIDKLNEIEKYLEELEGIIPISLEIYQNDLKSKAACERYFEKIAESVVEHAFLCIKYFKLKTPEEEEDTFNILNDGGIISLELTTKLREIKGMRNILAHEYGQVDDEIVFESITNELNTDTQKFIESIKKYINN